MLVDITALPETERGLFTFDCSLLALFARFSVSQKASVMASVSRATEVAEERKFIRGCEVSEKIVPL